MSGGNWEGVAAYVSNGHENLDKYGTDLVNGQAKYKDVYQAAKQWTAASPDTATEHYALSTPTNGKYGDAMWETSPKSVAPWKDSWYNDHSRFPCSDTPFFLRGARYNGVSNAGVFCFLWSTGEPHVTYGFRVVVSVL